MTSCRHLLLEWYHSFFSAFCFVPPSSSFRSCRIHTCFDESPLPLVGPPRGLSLCPTNPPSSPCGFADPHNYSMPRYCLRISTPCKFLLVSLFSLFELRTVSAPVFLATRKSPTLSCDLCIRHSHFLFLVFQFSDRQSQFDFMERRS